MSFTKKLVLAAIATACSAGAHAAVLDLSGLIGGANLFTSGNYFARSSDVEGAMLVGGTLDVSSYAINQNNKDAYATNGNGYALVVGGDLKFSNGQINNGLYYVGGNTSLTSAGTPGSTQTADLPLSFTAVAATAKAQSTALSKLVETGTSVAQDHKMTLTGSGSGVQVFKLTNTELANINDFVIDNVAAGSTVVIDVSGTSASFISWGVELNRFASYNVVYNFADATNLVVQGVGMYGTLLAPNAAVTGAYGQINGNVIVSEWNSSVQINSNHYFVATDIPALVTQPVPEPETYAMLLAGLGLVGFIGRRRQKAAAAAR